jgi:hypothetical protein
MRNALRAIEYTSQRREGLKKRQSLEEPLDIRAILDMVDTVMKEMKK